MSDERVRIGMTPPHPGSFIRTEILDELGLSVSRAADILGVRRATLSDLVNGKASLSPEMALRIEKAFGVSMDTLLRMGRGTTVMRCAAAPTRSTSSATNLRSMPVTGTRLRSQSLPLPRATPSYSKFAAARSLDCRASGRLRPPPTSEASTDRAQA